MKLRPMRLTPFEWYMLDAGGEGAAMTFLIRLRFSGRFDPTAFESAIHRAVRRHPLLCCHVAGGLGGFPARGRSLRWVPAADPWPFVDHAAEGVPLVFPGSEGIDLRQETGLRVWVRYGEARTEMCFQFHHACCDGIGAYRVIEDVLCAYDNAVAGRASIARLRPLDCRRLATRAQVAVERAGIVRRLVRDVFLPCLRTARFFLARPTPLAVPPTGAVRREPPSDGSGEGGTECGGRHPLSVPNFLSHTFDRSETARLRQVAAASGGSTNDVLLRDLFRAVDRWNGRFGHVQDAGMIRILVPITLRTPADENLPAANCVSMVALNRPRASLEDPSRLLVEVVRQLRFVRAWRIDLVWLRAVAAARALSEVVAWFRQPAKRCYATTVLSNTGKLFAGARLPRCDGRVVSGALQLEAVQSAPPITPYTPVVFGCGWYRGRLTVTTHYDRSQFSRSTAREMLRTFVAEIRAGIGDAGKEYDEAAVCAGLPLSR